MPFIKPDRVWLWVRMKNVLLIPIKMAVEEKNPSIMAQIVGRRIVGT